MNEVLVIACLGWWWQHFTLFWSPAPVWCQPPLRGTLSCHAVATSPQLPRPQWSKLQTVQRAGSGTNIALCHHYFNNFEYFEYFNHWVTPWLQVPIFQSFSFNWECIASVHGSWTQFWVFYKLLPWHLVTMWHWPEVMPDVRPEQERPHQPMGGRPPLPAGGASASHSRERKSWGQAMVLHQWPAAWPLQTLSGQCIIPERDIMTWGWWPRCRGPWLIVPWPGLCHCKPHLSAASDSFWSPSSVHCSTAALQ